MQRVKNLLLVPAAALVFVAAWYVATGSDLLPGDYGGRWYMLVVLAFIGVLGRAVL